MSFMNKMSTFFGLEDDEYMEEEKHVASKPVVHQAVQRPVQQPVKQTQAKVQPVQQQPAPQAHQKEPVKSKNIFKSKPAKQPVVDTRSTAVRKPQEQPVVHQERTQPQSRPEPKIVAMQQAPRANTKVQSAASKILIVEPRVYSEAMTIAKHVMSGESVLVNFHLIEEYQARRIVDFLTGTVYAEDGDIKRVADEIFLCTPKGTEIDGTAKSLVENNMFDI